jgi:hypothetical protein
MAPRAVDGPRGGRQPAVFLTVEAPWRLSSTRGCAEHVLEHPAPPLQPLLLLVCCVRLLLACSQIPRGSRHTTHSQSRPTAVLGPWPDPHCQAAGGACLVRRLPVDLRAPAWPWSWSSSLGCGGIAAGSFVQCGRQVDLRALVFFVFVILATCLLLLCSTHTVSSIELRTDKRLVGSSLRSVANQLFLNQRAVSCTPIRAHSLRQHRHLRAAVGVEEMVRGHRGRVALVPAPALAPDVDREGAGGVTARPVRQLAPALRHWHPAQHGERGISSSSSSSYNPFPLPRR